MSKMAIFRGVTKGLNAVLNPVLSKKTGGHVTSAFGTPRQKLGLGIVQNWAKVTILRGVAS